MSGSGDQLFLDMPVARTVTIVNELGLHARPAAKLVECVKEFDAVVTLTKDGETVIASSIMGILMLGAGKGEAVVLSATGKEAGVAIGAIEALIKGGFPEFEHTDSGKETSD